MVMNSLSVQPGGLIPEGGYLLMGVFTKVLLQIETMSHLRRIQNVHVSPQSEEPMLWVDIVLSILNTSIFP